MGVSFQDYYKILHVSRDASPAEIQRSYRALARKYHPDLNKDPSAEDDFKRIAEAYEVLSDPEARERYDGLGSGWKAGQEFKPPPGYDSFRRFERARNAQEERKGTGEGFSAFFDSLFGEVNSRDNKSRARNNSGSNPQGFTNESDRERVKGTDIRGKVEITVPEAYNGARKTVTLERPDNQSHYRNQKVKKSFRVTIPPQTLHGQTVRLSGQGNSGIPGAKSGDLLLKVKIISDDVFQLKGSDVIQKVFVTPWEAMLGARIDIKLLDGSIIQVKIPENSQYGKRLRLKEKGFPRLNGESGDLFLELVIVNPPVVSTEERALWLQLAHLTSFNPREKAKTTAS